MDKKDIKDPNYRGVDVDAADDNKVDSKLVEQETRILNDNPRNDADIDD